MGTPDPFTILLARIRAGVYPPGAWLAPERDLALDIGVHRNTVRRAIGRLADLGYVDKQPGCRPVVRARTVAADQPGAIALLMGNEPRFHAFQSVLRGCETGLADSYRLIFIDTYGPTDAVTSRRESQALESLCRHPVDGIVLWCQNPESALPLLKELRERGTHVVLIDRRVPGFDADFVGVDNVHAAMEVVSHLISTGHRRIAFMTWRDETSAVVEREEGYRRALERHGIPFDGSLIYRLDGDLHERAVDLAAAEIAAQPDRPTALFAVNDIIAHYVIDALPGVGLQIPRDIALAGFDDIESLIIHSPFLTTVRQPYEAMGERATRLLLDRLAAPEAPIRHLLLGTSLVVRASTQPSPEASASPAAAGAEPQKPAPERQAVASLFTA